MPDQAPAAGAPAATPAATSTPAAMLASASMLLIATWLIFSVALDATSVPTQSLIAALILLLPRFWPGTPAAALSAPVGQFLLGLVIAASAAIWLVEDIGYLIHGNLRNEAIWFLGTAVHYVAGGMAFLGIRGLSR